MTLRFSLLPLLGAVALGYLVALGGMYVFQRRLLYHPDRQPPPPPAAFGLSGMSEVWLTAGDGVRLSAWYAPPPKGGAVVLYLHGNAGNLGTRPGRLNTYLQAGFGVLAPDWRGYGNSGGEPSEDGLYADGFAALSFLRNQGISDSRIVVHGESLGSGVATKLAACNRFAALILEAPFTSINDAAQQHYPFLPARWLVKDRFDNLSRIGMVQAPVLILHGELDRTVPVSQGRALLAAAGPMAQGHFLAKAGHMDSFEMGGGEIALDFLRQKLKDR